MGHWKWCFIFLSFLLLVVFAALLSKTLWKNYLFQYKFPKVISRSTILETFRKLNFLSLKWWPFQYNVKFKTNTSFIIILMRLLSKNLWKNYPFSIKSFNIHFSIYHFSKFSNLKLSATKMTALAINCKNRKKCLFECCFHSCFVNNFMKKFISQCTTLPKFFCLL